VRERKKSEKVNETERMKKGEREKSEKVNETERERVRRGE